ncbi:MAG: hypothetical protein ABS79_03735 [Planctomycetes bacterium SCN 63-9]|nr:MAG: hypothetical protein ABS79_03735 [Planctomycetes bacterium SCN 63-9]
MPYRSPFRFPLRTVMASIRGRSLATASSLISSSSVKARLFLASDSSICPSPSRLLQGNRLTSTHQLANAMIRIRSMFLVRAETPEASRRLR